MLANFASALRITLRDNYIGVNFVCLTSMALVQILIMELMDGFTSNVICIPFLQHIFGDMYNHINQTVNVLL